MSSQPVTRDHIWNNLPLQVKGLTLLIVPVPALLVSAGFMSGTWREERQAIGAFDRVVAGQQRLREIGSMLAAPGNPTQDYRALANLTRDLDSFSLNPDRAREMDAVIQEKLQLLAALGATGTPDQSLLDKNRETTATLQAQVSALGADYQRLLAIDLHSVESVRAKFLRQVAMGAFVFVLGELLSALVFLGAMTEQVRTLKTNSRRLAEGLPLLPLFTDNWELNQIGRDLMYASVSLAERERESGGAQQQTPEHREHPEAVPFQESAAEALRERNQNLAAALSAAKESLVAKGRFLADLSRELRIPLSSILGFSELLYDGKLGPVNEQQKGCLSDILAGSKRMLQLADGLVGAARADLAPAPAGVIDLENLVKEIVYSLVPVAGKKGIQLEASVEEGLREVKADADKLKQALHKRLASAIQFTPHDSRLAMCVKPEGAGGLRFEVEHTGIGMMPHDVLRLYPEFRMDDPARPVDGITVPASQRSGYYSIITGVNLPIPIVRSRTAASGESAPALVH